MAFDERDLIDRLFRPLAGPGSLDLQDDTALVVPPPDCDLVITKDMIAAGVHFLPDDPPETVARKALRVNLSDLAAKGAEPLGYLLGAGFGRRCLFRYRDRNRAVGQNGHAIGRAAG